MPKQRKYDRVRCKNFVWSPFQRDGVWYADGRLNQPNAGRHSLGTRDYDQALRELHQLDAQVAFQLGLAPQPTSLLQQSALLTLEDGRKRYETHIKRPIVAGGVKSSTQKRYRAVLDKFVTFAKANDVVTWNKVDIALVHAYVGHLEENGYASKTLRNEMVTIAQIQHWLIEAKHLISSEPLKLSLRPVESERPYCYSTEEVAAMVQHCRSIPALIWLANVIVALATTGLRIAEVAGLKWTDIDLAKGHFTLTDETGRTARNANTKKRRQLKSGRSRQLPLHPDFIFVLNTIHPTDSFVFHGPRGGRLKPDTVRNVFVRDVIKPLAGQFPSAAGEQGFSSGRLHSFRHYFASECAKDPGISLFTAMEWMGHADSAMLRHYFHVHDEEGQRQMRRLNLLGEAGQQRPGVQGAASISKEEPCQGSDPAIAT